MKTAMLAMLLVVLTGCTTHTEYGQCVGIADTKDPSLVYKVSTWNLIVGAVFFESIAPPIIVLADETFCPVGKRAAQ